MCGWHNAKHLYPYSGRFPLYSGRFPQIVQSGCISAAPSPHSAKKSPFPGIRKAGRGRTLSGQMTPFLHFISLGGKLFSLPPYILTFYQSKHSKRTTQASYQNLGGYMASYGNSDTRDVCTRKCKAGASPPCLHHFFRHDSALLRPERNTVRPDFPHAIPT